MNTKLPTVEQFISEYVALQSSIMQTFRRELGSRDWECATDIPRRGLLVVQAREWSWQVHGTGVRFTSDGTVVDMNRHIGGDLESFDAGRLAEYGTSKGGAMVKFEGVVTSFDHDSGPGLLRSLQKAGRIDAVAGVAGEVYRLPR